MARLGFQDVFATARRAATLTKAGVRAHVIKDFTGFTAPMNPRFKPVIPLDQPVSLFSGSGRGRMPMPLVHDMGAHYYSARGGNAVIRTTDRDRWLSLFPVYEHGGLHALFRCMVSGAALVLPGAREALPDAADKYEVTHLILSPRQLQRWCAQGKDAMKIKTLRKVIVLARRTPIQALENLRQLGLQAHAGYAVPEAAGPVTLETNAGARQPQDTSGVAHPYCRVHLDAKGGIYLKGPTLMAGHWQQSRFMPLSDGDAWHPTGDKGRIDAAGRLIVQ
jgi:O-succinylbenzoic acid--CoA ligase